MFIFYKNGERGFNQFKFMLLSQYIIYFSMNFISILKNINLY